MKIAYVGFVLLCMLALASAATGNPSAASQSIPATHQVSQATEGQVSLNASAQMSESPAILSRAEADSLSVLGDSLLAQSDVGDLKIGAVGSTDLIYILVVVLLVVVIISVAR